MIVDAVRNIHFGLLLGFLLLFPVATVSADEIQLRPLQVSNLAPLAQLCGLPPVGRSRLLGEGDYEVAFSWDLANSFTSGRNGSELVNFDGETDRVSLRLDYGWSDRWEIGVDLPLVAHRRGSLDGFIETWHDLFGLPQGGRDQTERNQLDYSYQDGPSILTLNREETGLGDIALFLNHQLNADEDSSLAILFGLELPTGSESEWLGSGSLDATFKLSGDRLWRIKKQRIGFFWSGGVLLSDGNGVLSAQREPLVGVASLGLAWTMWQPVVFQFQLDGHTSLFSDSALTQIGDGALLLSLGGAVVLTEKTRLELAVVEDLAVATAPDVTFHLRLSQQF